MKKYLIMLSAFAFLAVASCSSDDKAPENKSRLLTYRIRTSENIQPNYFDLREQSGSLYRWIVFEGSENPEGWQKQFYVNAPFEAYMKVVISNSWIEQGVDYTYDILLDNEVVATKSGNTGYLVLSKDSIKYTVPSLARR
ncbi:hypothetical protein [Flavobacterium pallidum]|uniref:Uncharacterized protein n=1 Tax=Flavobacterium pallidum TaxID=2172098 RepID=A0A2S1SIB6_9FLAO|nr:hypothetical protein [Flavobacterium pallidum]AWI26087.1 hypothetical protein HYN49_09360 [Flavobacterium pallidum]